MSPTSRSLGWFLRGDSFGEPDLCVLVNAWTEPLEFDLAAGASQEPRPWAIKTSGWRLIVDTADSEYPFQPTGVPVQGSSMWVAPRSVVVLEQPPEE